MPCKRLISGFLKKAKLRSARTRRPIEGIRYCLLKLLDGLLLAFESLAQPHGYVDQVVTDRASGENRIGEGDGNDFCSSQSHHRSKFLAVDEINRPDTVTRRQHTIKRAGRATALDVSQHHSSSFESGAAFNLARENVADA